LTHCWMAITHSSMGQSGAAAPKQTDLLPGQ
jgi:hypothetical protein